MLFIEVLLLFPTIKNILMNQEIQLIKQNFKKLNIKPV